MWYAGQKIVCIKEIVFKNTPSYEGCIKPELNKIYTIREIQLGSSGQECFKLHEIHNPIRTYLCGPARIKRNDEIVYLSTNFKPLEEKKTDISIFTEMLNKTPKEMVENLKKLNTVEKEHA